MQQSNAGDGWILKQEEPVVTIFHGCSSTNVAKKQFQRVIYYSLKESTDISKLGKNNGRYLNAFEWLLANLYRVAGIQLYSDFNIRINIIPAEVDYQKRCIFLTDVDIINTELNNNLYGLLMEFIYGKVSKNVC